MSKRGLIKERKFKIGSVEINCTEGPQAGSPIILLLGLLDRWQELMPIMPTLILQWHLLALDLQGQEKSCQVPGQFQYKHYVADVANFLSIKRYYAKELDHVFTTNF